MEDGVKQHKEGFLFGFSFLSEELTCISVYTLTIMLIIISMYLSLFCLKDSLYLY